MSRPKASDIAGPRDYVARALAEIGPADARELAHHAAMIGHSAGDDEGYRRGWARGTYCIGRGIVMALSIVLVLQLLTLAGIVAVWLR